MVIKATKQVLAHCTCLLIDLVLPKLKENTMLSSSEQAAHVFLA